MGVILIASAVWLFDVVACDVLHFLLVLCTTRVHACGQYCMCALLGGGLVGQHHVASECVHCSEHWMDYGTSLCAAAL
jgi:hypothetical protein